MNTRHRIKQDESEYLFGICRVQVNSLDICAWPLFAQLKKDMLAWDDDHMSKKFDIGEALRKIAVKVPMTCLHVYH